MERKSVVYLLTDLRGHYKIGYSRNLETRVRYINQDGYEARLVTAVPCSNPERVEGKLHNLYRRNRIPVFGNGSGKTEWFKFAPWQVPFVVARMRLAAGMFPLMGLRSPSLIQLLFFAAILLPTVITLIIKNIPLAFVVGCLLVLFWK